MRGSPVRRLPYLHRSSPPPFEPNHVHAHKDVAGRRTARAPGYQVRGFRQAVASPPIDLAAAVQDKVLNGIEKLADPTIDDVILTVSTPTPILLVQPLVDAFLNRHGNAENIYDGANANAASRQQKNYHCGLDLVVSQEQPGGFTLYLTAGTRLFYAVLTPASFTVTLQNTARPPKHRLDDGIPYGGVPNLDEAAIHRQMVRYHRPAGELRFLPLQFQAVRSEDRCVKSVAYQSIRLNKHSKVRVSDYVALQAWFTGIWRHAGTSCYFDKRRVEFVVRNSPPGADEARSAIENVQNAYVLVMRDNLGAYFAKKGDMPIA